METQQNTTAKQEYNFICKNRNYKNIEIFNILKNLLVNHKINKYDYKNSIHRINKNRKLQTKIQTSIHFYLSTIKTNTNKNIITALTKRQHNNKRFVNLYADNNQKYAIHIKKNKYMDLVQNKYLSNEYKDLMVDSIKKEFNTLLSNKNKEVSEKVDTLLL